MWVILLITEFIMFFMKSQYQNYLQSVEYYFTTINRRVC